MGLAAEIVRWEGRVRAHYNVDPTIPGNGRKAWIYNNFFDHAFLRSFWTNFHEVSPGVYRSNQPTHTRLQKMRDQGIRTILTLRGASDTAHYLTELVSCQEIGLDLRATSMQARAAATQEELLNLIAAFRAIERPFVMHCKSGADRAGLASAIWLMVMEGEPVEKARRMLSPRYLHIRNSHVGILDHMLDCYADRNARSPISFEDWVANEYDRPAIQAGFKGWKLLG